MISFRCMARIAGLLLLLLLVPTAGSAQTPGQVETIRVHGPSLEGNLSGDDPTRDVSVFLPPGYADNPDKRYPVIYFLHPYGPPRMLPPLMAPTLDAAWRDGAEEMIMVVPHADTRFGGSMYSNSVTTGDWEAFVAKELVAHIDTHYRTLAARESRGLAGHSMGGYGTLRIGMKYPDVFAALYVMSPCCMAPPPMQLEQFQDELAVIKDATQAAVSPDGRFVAYQLPEASVLAQPLLAAAAAWSPNPASPPFYLELPFKDGELQPDVSARWVANSPLAMVHQYIPQLKSFREIYVDVGDRDVGGPTPDGILGWVRELDVILTGYGVEHRTEIYSGDHVSGMAERVRNHLMPMFFRVLVSQS